METFAGVNGGDILFILEDGPGIYSAMNSGIAVAAGKYIYFIGQDDVILPDAVQAIQHGNNDDADIILADVFWGKGRIHKNYALKQSLVWTNWCHQGVFYKRETFLRTIKTFPVEYKAQADHYSNIVLSSDRAVKIAKYIGCVSWYSATGYSTQSPDLVFRAAFPALVRKHVGLISYSAVVLRRAALKCIRLIWKPQ
jgi:glycosyltransferase involved in cell wall biosynthesis